MRANMKPKGLDNALKKQKYLIIYGQNDVIRQNP